MVDFSGLRVKLFCPTAKLPTKAYYSAGYDLYSPVDVALPALNRSIISLGIATEMPYGYFGKIMDRSGLAAKQGLTVLGGVIDNDYRGEWKVVLLNTTQFQMTVKAGDRIAQVVFLPYGHFEVNEVECLTDTERGEDGFGSTGR
jgi:dUTP pyrophosphatase